MSNFTATVVYPTLQHMQVKKKNQEITNLCYMLQPYMCQQQTCHTCEITQCAFLGDICQHIYHINNATSRSHIGKKVVMKNATFHMWTYLLQ